MYPEDMAHMLPLLRTAPYHSGNYRTLCGRNRLETCRLYTLCMSTGWKNPGISPMGMQGTRVHSLQTTFRWGNCRNPMRTGRCTFHLDSFCKNPHWRSFPGSHGSATLS